MSFWGQGSVQSLVASLAPLRRQKRHRALLVVWLRCMPVWSFLGMDPRFCLWSLSVERYSFLQLLLFHLYAPPSLVCVLLWALSTWLMQTFQVLHPWTLCHQWGYDSSCFSAWCKACIRSSTDWYPVQRTPPIFGSYPRLSSWFCRAPWCICRLWLVNRRLHSQHTLANLC